MLEAVLHSLTAVAVLVIVAGFGWVTARKGWYDEAARSYTQACQMDPSNLEYRTALNNLNMSGGYGGYRPMQETNMCDFCLQLAICNCCLNSCCNAGC